MSSALYTRDMLRWAAQLPLTETLDTADGHGDARSASCGSTLSAQVRVDAAGRITDVACAVRACAVGQASAAMLLSHIKGMDAGNVAARRAMLAAGLTGQGDWPTDWPEWALLAPVREYPARHGAALLAYDALLAALGDAGFGIQEAAA